MYHRESLGTHYDSRNKWLDGILSIGFGIVAGKNDPRGDTWNLILEKGTKGYDNFYEKGTYHCAGCDEALYKSDHKYNSYCGWPSFDREISDKLVYDVDYKLGYPRTEIKCKKCGGHLGHVFNDGPKETTGIRHCVNSVALVFKKS